MPRSIDEDFYQNHRYHVVDITQATSLSGGAVVAPFLVMSPQVGFQSVQLPDISMSVQEFNPGNAPFSKAVASKGSIGNLVLSRGVYVGDKEFYDWMMSAIYGRGSYKRTLLMFQYSKEPSADTDAGRYLKIMASVGATLAFGDSSSPIAAVAGSGLNALGIDLYARLWKLDDVFPVRYAPAAGFEASDDGITIAELELHVGSMIELTLGRPPITRGV